MADAERHVRPFAEFLIEQRKGAAHNEMSEGLNDLIDAVVTHGKGGELTLTIKVKPADKGARMVVVTDRVAVKLPESDRPAAFFYVDDQSNLSRSDPNQPQLPLRAVDTPEAKEAQQ